MKVTTLRTYQKIKRSADITEDRPRVGMAYATRPTEVEIDHVEIEYTFKDGAWVVDSNFSATVSGYTIKKDGTPSKNRHSRAMPSSYDRDPAWPWLDAIIDLLRPDGSVAYTILNESEVRA